MVTVSPGLGLLGDTSAALPPVLGCSTTGGYVVELLPPPDEPPPLGRELPPVAGMLSVSVTQPQTVHSLCRRPAALEDAGISTIHSLGVWAA